MMQWEDCKKQLAKLLWLTCKPRNIEKERLRGEKLSEFLFKNLFRPESSYTAMTEVEHPAALLMNNAVETGSK